MIVTLLSCVFALAAAQDPAAPPAASSITLDELIAKTNDLKSFSAQYQLTTSKAEGEELLLIDYVAPDKLRVDRVAKMGGGSSIWCIGGVLTLQAHGQNAMHGSADYSVALGNLRAAQRVFEQNFPGARSLVGHAGAYVNMRWWFDAKAGKANYMLEALWAQNRIAVLGWLDSLRAKHVAPTDDGEHLVFDTDGAFHVLISKKTGFIDQLDGKSPNGEMHFKQLSLELDKPIDPSRFKVQEGITDGRECSEDLLRSMTRGVQGAMREGIYRVLAGEPGDPWKPEHVAKISEVLAAFHDRAIQWAIEPWLADARKKRDSIVEHVKQLAHDGKPADELAKLKEKEVGFLQKALDELRSGFTDGLAPPKISADLPRADDLLAIEIEVISKTFDQNIRGPFVREFERAIDAAIEGKGG